MQKDSLGLLPSCARSGCSMSTHILVGASSVLYERKFEARNTKVMPIVRVRFRLYLRISSILGKLFSSLQLSKSLGELINIWDLASGPILLSSIGFLASVLHLLGRLQVRCAADFRPHVVCAGRGWHD